MEASPDEFYLGFACHGCKKPIQIIIDDGNDGCRFVAEDVLQILCRQCGHQGHYAANQVERYSIKPEIGRCVTDQEACVTNSPS